jgi:hypothetical protein
MVATGGLKRAPVVVVVVVVGGVAGAAVEAAGVRVDGLRMGQFPS